MVSSRSLLKTPLDNRSSLRLRIESPPEASYTGSVETRVWTIRCHEMVWGLAGNEADQSIINQVGQLSSMLGQFGGNLGLFN